MGTNSQREKGKRSSAGRIGEDGQELVEFALALVVLLMLMLGIFWFARGYNVHETITRAAREGARVAAMPLSHAVSSSDAYPDSKFVFDNNIAPVLTSGHLDPAGVENYQMVVRWVSQLEANDPAAQCGVVVSFDYPFTFFIPFTSLRLATVPLHTQVQMRRESQPTDGTCG